MSCACGACGGMGLLQAMSAKRCMDALGRRSPPFHSFPLSTMPCRFHSAHDAAHLHATARAVSGEPATQSCAMLVGAGLGRAACERVVPASYSHSPHPCSACTQHACNSSALIVPFHPTPAILPPLHAGGMVYVSDKMGDHDFGLLRRLVLPDGSTLRCCLPGRPTLDCLMRDVSRDGRTVLKVCQQGVVSERTWEKGLWASVGCSACVCAGWGWIHRKGCNSAKHLCTGRARSTPWACSAC